MKLNKINSAFVLGFALLLSACNTFKLDINNDPNNPTSATPGLLLPGVESTIINTVESFNQSGMGFAGLINANDDYNMNNSSWNGTWNGFYIGMQNCEELIKATEGTSNTGYLGIAQVIKAYNVSMMVDAFGDIPYSEAWKGNAATAIIQAKFDKQEDIYESVLKLIDAGIANLGKPSPVTISGDLFFGGSLPKWVAAAKTIKLKMLMTSRKGRATGNADVVAAFKAGGFISGNANDFQFQHNKIASPEGRHPWFQNAYLADNGFSYPNHQLMGEMILNKDPRLPFYFYRQTEKVLDPANPTDRGTIPYGGTYLPTRPTFLEAYKKDILGGAATIPAVDIKFIAGYFGRDRSDNTGVPQDGALRTGPGTFPAGGVYSDRATVPKALTGGTGQGNGITQFITNANVLFYKTEAILDAGLEGDAKKEFEAAMRAHIQKVSDFSLTMDANAKAAAKADVDAYVAKWLALYDKAESNASKLSVVSKQVWFASWGQGIEIWNFMRRTGYPLQGNFNTLSTGIQDPILKPVRQFALRLPYSSQEGDLNPNAAPYVTNIIFDRDPIFWDKTKLKWTF